METNDKNIPENVAILNKRHAEANKNIRFDVPYISVDIVKDLEMTGEVGQKIVDKKASYINTWDDLNTTFLAFCKKMLGNDYEQRSVKTLSGALKEVMEELFEVFETDAVKIILSNDNVHHNREKFARVIAKALERYGERLRLRQAAAKRRAFKHYDWEVPADRAYPMDKYNEVPRYTDHALEPFYEYVNASDPEVEFAKFLEIHKDSIDWWYRNGDSGKTNYAIGYTNVQGEKALFYVDFIIRMQDGTIFLFDTKKGLIDPNVIQKHNALIDYINRENNKDKNLKGGILIQDNYGNWVYPQFKLENENEIDNPINWNDFIPEQYK